MNYFHFLWNFWLFLTFPWMTCRLELSLMSFKLKTLDYCLWKCHHNCGQMFESPFISQAEKQNKIKNLLFGNVVCWYMSGQNPGGEYINSTTAVGDKTTKPLKLYSPIKSYCSCRNLSHCSTNLAQEGSKSLKRIGSSHGKEE